MKLAMVKIKSPDFVSSKLPSVPNYRDLRYLIWTALAILGIANDII